ncbi:hypothetical protein ASF64_12850 [Arthrobacter sp. Leaf137]|nr:hypothetical protein ASF64_12850 [Arthrobacter sp. Leaf137]
MPSALPVFRLRTPADAIHEYGTVVTDRQPGDMIIQPGHVGIYLGDGQVLSSGLKGKNETAVHPLTRMTFKGSVTLVAPGCRHLTQLMAGVAGALGVKADTRHPFRCRGARRCWQVW